MNHESFAMSYYESAKQVAIDEFNAEIKDVHAQVVHMLENTGFLCQDIADKVGCDVEIVHNIVEARFKQSFGL